MSARVPTEPPISLNLATSPFYLIFGLADSLCLFYAVLRIRDPVPFRPLDPGWVNNQDPGSGPGISNPDHISESLETIFGVKNT
jgi:hypothetical protein